jgi:hypothetical protein
MLVDSPINQSMQSMDEIESRNENINGLRKRS